MKLIDLINRMYKRNIEIGFRFTLKYKEFTLNTYEIRECEYGPMIWDLDNDSRFDSNEYIFDYLDYEIIEEEKEIEKFSISKKMEKYYGIDYSLTHQEFFIQEKINELIREVNKIKKKGK